MQIDKKMTIFPKCSPPKLTFKRGNLPPKCKIYPYNVTFPTPNFSFCAKISHFPPKCDISPQKSTFPLNCYIFLQNCNVLNDFKNFPTK